MHVADDYVPQIRTGRRSRPSERRLRLRARFWAVACLACGALTNCGGRAESTQAPGSAVGTPQSAANPTEPSSEPVPGISGALPEESCEENPFLAKCPRAAPTPTPAAPDVPPTSSTGQAISSAVLQVEDVLFERCGTCHGGNPFPERCGTCDGMYYVENLRRLVESGYIVPCRWEGSPLFQRIADGNSSSQDTARTLNEMELVGDFVNGLCSNLTGGGSADTERADIERWLAADCGSCHSPAATAGGGPAPTTLDGVGDIAELIETGLIVPCDVDGSELVRVLRDDSMPPPGFNGPRPSLTELRELIAFIKRPCARF
jgi:mono/diheme cytochrome c family protein